MKHFINDRSAIVTEALETTVALSEGKLARLDGFPAIKVVVRADVDRSKVALISGGGSGHEPAHAGFVGDGMLTAAVCGEIFASPSVDAVLAAIVAVTGPAGCLLVVKSYTGDRLNFGLAAERARGMGLDVEMVVVADDVAIPGALRPRGIAGTLFVHKIAGHYARAGAPLASVKAIALRVADTVRSIGVSLSSVTIPGQRREERMKADEVELGLGIHGEPGARLVPLAPVRDLAALMTAELGDGTGPAALLVNDLGGVPPIEMAVATNAILSSVRSDVTHVIGPDRLMTSLDMKGLSISLLPLDDELTEALTSPVEPRAWPGAKRRIAPKTLPVSLPRSAFVPSAHPERRAAISRIRERLIGLEGELNALDAKIGDGDTGSTFATAARSIDVDALPLADPPSLCAAISEKLAASMGGSSGILLSIFAAAMAVEFHSFPEALRKGLAAVQHYGGASRGDRTMLDAFIPALEVLEQGGSIAEAAKAARAGAEATAEIPVARAGRSSYVRSEALSGVPDPGAIAVASIFEALA